MRGIFLCINLLLSIHILAQRPKQLTSAELYESIKKLNVLGSVLYVAAHPDDENTHLLSYFSNYKLYQTRYISLTRGDGGQNVIGPETQDLLGVIRTQELLSARRIDGALQSFSRANDFGFSKNPDETLKLWNKDEVLSDLVWAIRQYQPDVVINRFTTSTERPNHGHHTASAILSVEAYDICGKSDSYKEQLKWMKPWQPQRLLWNTSWWWYGSQETFAKLDKTGMLETDMGVYYPSKGLSNREIAAESRSQHRCQSMGTMSERGVYKEYFVHLKGEKAEKDIFEGINTTWTRIEGGANIAPLIQAAIDNYDYTQPHKSVPQLIKAKIEIEKLKDSFWKKTKLAELNEVIKQCLGLYLEATASEYSACPGDSIVLNFECTNRSQQPVFLQSLNLLSFGRDSTINYELKYNQPLKWKTKIVVPASTPLTAHYWLQKPFTPNMYQVDDQTLRGLPETPHFLKANFVLNIDNHTLIYPIDIAYKWEDNVRGEVFRPFEVISPVFANFTEKVILFDSQTPKNIDLKLLAGRKGVKGKVRLIAPNGWKIQPQSIDFNMTQKEEEQIVFFSVTPPSTMDEKNVQVEVEVDGVKYDRQMVTIKYDHIPVQTVLRPSTIKFVKLDIKKTGNSIGYIKGAGDEVPAALRQIGYQVTMLDDKDMNVNNLKNFDAIITGIRAYNVNEKMKFHQAILYDYVKNGGNLILQYNTNSDLNMNELAPYSMKLSRERVTMEDAEIRILKPEHPLLNKPNKITTQDFNGWVQERGLYFAGEWDKTNLEALFSCNDVNEPPREGSLLTGTYGKGRYTYTSLAFFRQLPAGVPGAFRLFANLISGGK